MRELTPEARRLVEDLRRRHGVSGDAVLTLLRALIAGGGAMAQFDHPELGGMGQWSRGGMVMVGDMFDHALKARVDALCSELAAHFQARPSGPARRRAAASAEHARRARTRTGGQRRRRAGRLVAGGTRPARLHRQPERRALRVLPRDPPPRRPDRRPHRRLRHRRAPDRRLLPAARWWRPVHVHRAARPGPPGGLSRRPFGRGWRYGRAWQR